VRWHVLLELPGRDEALRALHALVRPLDVVHVLDVGQHVRLLAEGARRRAHLTLEDFLAIVDNGDVLAQRAGGAGFVAADITFVRFLLLDNGPLLLARHHAGHYHTL